MNELETSASQSLSTKVPMAIWFTDTHQFTSQSAPAFLKENSFLFCFSKTQQQWFEKAKWNNSYYLPLAVDCTLFKPLEKNRQISFMGELRHMTTDSPMVKLLHPLRLKAYPATPLGQELQKFFEIIQQFLKQTAQNLTPINKVELFDDFRQFTPEKFQKYIELFSTELWQPALFENHNALQRATICQIYENELEIYGTYDDWRTLGKWPKHHKKRARYPEEWASMCGSSQISLNLFRPDPMHGIPLKAFEIAACSLLFTNDHPMLRTVFTPDENCIAFSSLNEAQDKYQMLKENPQLIKDISANSRKLMSGAHQYQHRWQFMENCFKESNAINI